MIQGSYIRVDDQGNFEDGLFTGNKISEDLSAYAPATIPTVEENASALKETEETAKPAPLCPIPLQSQCCLAIPSTRMFIPWRAQFLNP